MQSLNRGMKSLGFGTGGLLRVAKMLGRGGGFCSKEGALWVLCLKEAKKLEFRKGFEVGLLVLWPMVEVANQRVVSGTLEKENHLTQK